MEIAFGMEYVRKSQFDSNLLIFKFLTSIANQKLKSTK